MKTVGFILGGVALVYLVVLEIMTFTHWWGGIGLIAALIFSPIITVVFPFLLWAKEGFQFVPFLAWAAMIVGGVIIAKES